jgi:hypothetical protein
LNDHGTGSAKRIKHSPSIELCCVKGFLLTLKISRLLN